MLVAFSGAFSTGKTSFAYRLEKALRNMHYIEQFEGDSKNKSFIIMFGVDTPKSLIMEEDEKFVDDKKYDQDTRQHYLIEHQKENDRKHNNLIQQRREDIKCKNDRCGIDMIFSDHTIIDLCGYSSNPEAFYNKYAEDFRKFLPDIVIVSNLDSNIKIEQDGVRQFDDYDRKRIQKNIVQLYEKEENIKCNSLTIIYLESKATDQNITYCANIIYSLWNEKFSAKASPKSIPDKDETHAKSYINELTTNRKKKKKKNQKNLSLINI